MKTGGFKKYMNYKKLGYLIIPFIICSIILYLLPTNMRREIGISLLTLCIIPLVVNLIKYKFFAENKKSIKLIPLVLIILGAFIPTIVVIANPDFSIEIFEEKEVEDGGLKEPHDEDLIGKAEETDAIEVAVNDIDNSMFEMFYKFSYIKDGKLNAAPDCGEDIKVQTIMESIVRDIELLGLNEKKYSKEELNSGEYSNLTEKANKAEKEYRKIKSTQDKQKNISDINKYLNMRLDAYTKAPTCDLARLIGNTYVELSEQQVVNESIYSDCKAIKYYIDCCHMSEPDEKRDMFYEIGVRFNRIAEIANQICAQENSDEYKSLYIDSLYMSSAYYKLFQSSVIEDFKSSFYLARNYKFLGESMSGVNKIMYFERALDILYTLSNYPNLKEESIIAIYNTIYNILVEYRAVPIECWNKYNSTTIETNIMEMDSLKKQIKNND